MALKKNRKKKGSGGGSSKDDKASAFDGKSTLDYPFFRRNKDDSPKSRLVFIAKENIDEGADPFTGIMAWNDEVDDDERGPTFALTAVECMELAEIETMARCVYEEQGEWPEGGKLSMIHKRTRKKEDISTSVGAWVYDDKVFFGVKQKIDDEEVFKMSMVLSLGECLLIAHILKKMADIHLKEEYCFQPDRNDDDDDGDKKKGRRSSKDDDEGEEEEESSSKKSGKKKDKAEGNDLPF